MEKRKSKKAIATKCWTMQWTNETTHHEVIHSKIVLFSTMMSSQGTLGAPRLH